MTTSLQNLFQLIECTILYCKRAKCTNLKNQNNKKNEVHSLNSKLSYIKGLKIRGKNNCSGNLIKLLLIKCGDVEVNPGPRSLLKIISYNLNGGLQNHKKQKRIINRCIKSGSNSIFMFQETHLTHNNEFILKARWPGAFVASHHTSNSAGVLILYNPIFWDEILYDFADPEGRYAILVVKLQSRSFIFVNVYSFNDNNKNLHLLESIFYTISINCDKFPESEIILAGDFNVTLTDIDSINRGTNSGELRYRDRLQFFKNSHNLIDTKDNLFFNSSMPTFK